MMRFNHMELTVPIGSLTTAMRKEVDDFYGSVFGWNGHGHGGGQPGLPPAAG